MPFLVMKYSVLSFSDLHDTDQTFAIILQFVDTGVAAT